MKKAVVHNEIRLLLQHNKGVNIKKEITQGNIVSLGTVSNNRILLLRSSFKYNKGTNIRNQLMTRDIIIFGAGGGGVILLNQLKQFGYKVKYFCDNDQKKWGETIEGVSIISADNLLKLNKESYYLCIASDWAKEIAVQLKTMGINDYYTSTHWYEQMKESFEPERIHENIDKIEKIYQLLSDNESRKIYMSILKYRLTMDPNHLIISQYVQYFHPNINLNNNEIIIDGGAYDGSTSIDFLKRMKGECRIFSFEPAESNYRLLRENLKKTDTKEIEPVMAGLWENESTGLMKTDLEYGETYYIDDAGGLEIKLTSIDTFVEKNKVIPSIIKMDVEGSELKALKGARQTITSHRPKLIVCVYHKPEDLWEIPLYISSLESNYNFYLGHHDKNIAESVLYCL